jgi:hypothetical protein
MSSGFQRPVENGLKDQVGEYIVGINFPERFPAEVVSAARAKLIAHEVVAADEMRHLTAEPRKP